VKALVRQEPTSKILIRRAQHDSPRLAGLLRRSFQGIRVRQPPAPFQLVRESGAVPSFDRRELGWPSNLNWGIYYAADRRLGFKHHEASISAANVKLVAVGQARRAGRCVGIGAAGILACFSLRQGVPPIL
jgi:hypothetical protein